MEIANDRDRDAIIRTVLGEADDQGDLGQATVAHVILNRVRAGTYGDSAYDIVHAKGQFEPWSTRASYLNGISKKSDQYQRVGDIVDQVLSGAMEDPTRGATHFLAPAIVGARVNRGVMKWPSWASPDATTAIIRGHAFYLPKEPRNARLNAGTTAPGFDPFAGYVSPLNRKQGAPQPAQMASAIGGTFTGDPFAGYKRGASATAAPPSPDKASGLPQYAGDPFEGYKPASSRVMTPMSPVGFDDRYSAAPAGAASQPPPQFSGSKDVTLEPVDHIPDFGDYIPGAPDAADWNFLKGRGYPKGTNAEKAAALTIAGLPWINAGVAPAVAAIARLGPLGRILSVPARGAAIGAATNAGTSGTSDQPFLDQVEEGAGFGAVGGVAAKGLGIAAKGAGKAINYLAGHSTTGEEFINRLTTAGLVGALGFGTIDPEHWERDVAGELATLAAARGARSLVSGAQSLSNRFTSAPPPAPRGPGGRFTTWTPQYRQQRTNASLWGRFKQGSQSAVDAISPALGALLGRSANEPEAGR